ncbi:hypothetical protein TCAL_10690 [Tigriopus californicus]|uniref:RING-type domain-containing protein n=1 Tax=Tigriopus californicus TaxID=6832 RepID=A0A553NZY7_TIGCA|nr:uncharacterized protein LOC131887395 [Tigriopus californicus]TRY71006.1 hypothetical protein TCAL_10690 [Tigriopus californicus]
MNETKLAEIERFWSRGKLARVSTELTKILRDMGQDPQDPTTDRATSHLATPPATPEDCRHARQVALLVLQLCHCHLVQQQFDVALTLLRQLNAGITLRLVEQPWFERLYGLYLAVYCLGQGEWDLALFLSLHFNAQADPHPMDKPDANATPTPSRPSYDDPQVKSLWNNSGHLLLSLGQSVVRWHPEVIPHVRCMTAAQAQARLQQLLQPQDSEPNPRPTPPRLTVDPRRILQTYVTPDSQTPHVSRARVALNLKKYSLAIVNLNQMLTSCPPAQVGPIHYMMGHCHEAQGEFDLGQLAFQNCFQTCPGLAAFGLARIGWAKSKFEESHATLMKHVVFNETDITMCQWPENLKDLFEESDRDTFHQLVKRLLTQLEEALEKERQRVTCASNLCPHRSKNGRSITNPDINLQLDHVVIDCTQGCSLAFHGECAPSDTPFNFSCPSQSLECPGEMKAFWIRPEGRDKLPELKAANVIPNKCLVATQSNASAEIVHESDVNTPSAIPKKPKKKPSAKALANPPQRKKTEVPHGFNDKVAFYRKETKPVSIAQILIQNGVIQIDNLITSSENIYKCMKEHLWQPGNHHLEHVQETNGIEYQSEKEMTYHLYQCLKRSNQLLAGMRNQSRKEHVLLADVMSGFELCVEAVVNHRKFNPGTHEKLDRFSSLLRAYCQETFPNYPNIIEPRKMQLRQVLGLLPEDQAIEDVSVPPSQVHATPATLVPEIPQGIIDSAAFVIPSDQDLEINRLHRHYPDMDIGELLMLIEDTRQFHQGSVTEEVLHEAIEEFRRVEGYPVSGSMENNSQSQHAGEKLAPNIAHPSTNQMDGAVHDVLSKLLLNISSYQPQVDVEDINAEDCTVCLETLGMTDLETLQPCQHRFHRKCIRDWLSQQRDCPLCRNHILLDEDFPKLQTQD